MHCGPNKHYSYTWCTQVMHSNRKNQFWEPNFNLTLRNLLKKIKKNVSISVTIQIKCCVKPQVKRHQKTLYGPFQDGYSIMYLKRAIVNGLWERNPIRLWGLTKLADIKMVLVHCGSYNWKKHTLQALINNHLERYALIIRILTVSYLVVTNLIQLLRVFM